MSLRWQLVVLYAVVLAAVIAAFSVAMVWALRGTLERGLATELDARARGVGAVVEHEGGAWVLEAKSGLDPEFAAGSGRYYRVLDAQGGELLASPLARTLAAGTTATGSATGPATDGHAVRAHDGHRYLETTLAVTKTSDEDEAVPPTTVFVRCGADLREIDLAVASLAQLLCWLGPLVLLASLAGGLWLASRGLRPIDRIARTAAAIGAHDLDRRIPVRGRDELATLARTLNATFDRLQQAFERQQRFTADASHELRTPLAAIAANAELLLARARTPEEQRELVQEIGAAAAQMQALIEGLLTLARADQGDLGRQRIALLPLCREVVANESAAAHAVGVALACDGTDDLAVRGDATCLRQLLGNLVQNGVRYSREGGHVVVHASATDGVATLVVEDDGIGIPAAALPLVGERFFRVDAARSRATGGVGLGLSIAKAIAAAHGGDLRVESEERAGTRVTVTLPAA